MIFQRLRNWLKKTSFPLEESLYLNKAKEARQQLMELANNGPISFYGFALLGSLK